MDTFIIEGGVPLKGEVEVSGSKNAALPLLAASLLSEKTVVLSNVPTLRDVTTMTRVLQGLGARVEAGDHRLAIEPRITRVEAPYELVRTMRASIYVMGPLLAREGRVRCALPGGCVIGQRPINLHLRGFEALGAKVELKEGYVEARAKGLKGADITMDVVSVGATANLLMGAVLARGRTVLRNAAREPHIVELGEFLNGQGARIEGLGSDTLRIEGVARLEGGSFRIRPDYIEAGTLLAAAAITGGAVRVANVPVADVEPVLTKLAEAGVPLAVAGDRVTAGRVRRLRAVNVTTAAHPAFPTDMQAQWMALMTLARGTSLVTETVWESRFMHAAELTRMGADIAIEGNAAVVKGVRELRGAPVMVSDLRAGAALVIAGLAAKGRTVVQRVYHLDRGYERLERKLSALGARIRRVNPDAPRV